MFQYLAQIFSYNVFFIYPFCLFPPFIQLGCFSIFVTFYKARLIWRCHHFINSNIRWKSLCSKCSSYQLYLNIIESKFIIIKCYFNVTFAVCKTQKVKWKFPYGFRSWWYVTICPTTNGTKTTNKLLYCFNNLLLHPDQNSVNMFCLTFYAVSPINTILKSIYRKIDDKRSA